ncbi:uncharacterized protein LOC121421014 [Lytechinus variegatus]|uniref:uncharacterized protein LOC121421014 n=1 Tax=Lytechinus variegatus TaxID=7654 RepID=UPI001BB0DA5C|nr:uncharacterized protein LOC121421014 [Lytechinus variegatus]
MDDFKFNAQKMLAAQRAKDRRAQSPETESNWDSSEPEENTVTQISSDEEFSVKSTRSHKSTKSSRGTSKADSSKTRTSSKPDPLVSHKRDSKPTTDGLSSSKGSERPAVNVFIDRGGIDSDDQSQKSSTKKTKKKKEKNEKNPPYDFREALKDDDGGPPSQKTAQRPGRTRKGESYDPAPPKTKAKSRKEQVLDSASWDESADENQKALTRILRERDGLEANNNTNNSEPITDPKADLQPEDNSPKKKKGWSISLKSKSKEKKTKKTEEPPREMQVAMTTPPVPSLKHSEVDVVYKKEEEDVETIISLDEDDRETRFVYIYHHGNTSYADTRPSQEPVYMTTIADKSELIFRRCAREIFATLRILVDFVLIFLLEGLRFLAYNIISALLVGVTTGFGDYFLRPVATAIFNGLCQPCAMFCFNVGVATRTSTRPFVDVLHNFLSVIAMVIRAFRLVEVNQNRPQQTAAEDV